MKGKRAISLFAAAIVAAGGLALAGCNKVVGGAADAAGDAVNCVANTADKSDCVELGCMCVDCGICPLCIGSNCSKNCGVGGMRLCGWVCHQFSDDITGEEGDDCVAYSVCDIKKSPVEGSKRFSVVTVELGFALEGQASFDAVHVHAHLILDDERTIDTTNHIGTVSEGEKMNTQFRFYVDDDLPADAYEFEYFVYCAQD